MVRPEDGVKNSDALRQLVPEQSGFRFATPAGAETVATQCPVTLPVIPAPTVLRLVPVASQAPGLCPSDRHEGAVAVVDLQVVGPVAVVLQLVELVEAVVGPDVVAGADLPPCAPTTLGRQMGVRNGWVIHGSVEGMAGGLVGPGTEAKRHPDQRVQSPKPGASGRALCGVPAMSSIAPASP